MEHQVHDPLASLNFDAMEHLLLGYILTRPRDFVNFAVASPYTGQTAEELLSGRAWVTKAVDNLSEHFRNTDQVNELIELWPGWSLAANNFYDQIFRFNHDNYSFPFLLPHSSVPLFGTGGMNKLWLFQVATGRNGGNMENVVRFPNMGAGLELGAAQSARDWEDLERIGNRIRFGTIQKTDFANNKATRKEIFGLLDRWLSLVPNLNALYCSIDSIGHLVRIKPLPSLPHLVNLTLSASDVLGSCFPFMKYWDGLTTLDVSTFCSFLDEYDYFQKHPSVFPHLQRLSVYLTSWEQGEKLKNWRSPLKEFQLVLPPGSEFRPALDVLNTFKKTLLLARIKEQHGHGYPPLLDQRVPQKNGQPAQKGGDDDVRLPNLRVLSIQFLHSMSCICAVKALSATLGYLQVKILQQPANNKHNRSSQAHARRLFNPRLWARMPGLQQVELQGELFNRNAIITDAPLKRRL